MASSDSRAVMPMGISTGSESLLLRPVLEAAA